MANLRKFLLPHGGHIDSSLIFLKNYVFGVYFRPLNS